jgi:hypothetical protein
MSDEPELTILGESARVDLKFPPVDTSTLGSADLIGFHSSLNWIIPEYTLGRSLRLSLLLFDKVIAETNLHDTPDRIMGSVANSGRRVRIS